MITLRRLWQTLRAGPSTLPPEPADDAATRQLAARIDAAAQRRLGRSLAIRHVDAGGCNGCALELQALSGLVHDLERFGLRFVASPRHADVLLVTGPVTTNMQDALVRTWNAMTDPKWVVSVGDCAIDGGVFRGCYAVIGGATDTLPVDVIIRGCPPTPAQVLLALRTLVDGNAR